MYVNFLRRIIAKKTSDENIDRALDYVLGLDGDPDPSEKVDNRFALVQREIKPVKQLEAYIFDLYLFIKDAEKARANYCIFPEYNFFDLFGMIPGFSLINRFLNRRARKGPIKEAQAFDENEGNKFLRNLFELYSLASERVLLRVMKRLASHFKIYIYTGTYILKEGEDLFNRGTLIDPEGEIIIHQDKVHLTDFETSIGLKRRDDFQVLSLPAGKVSLPICMDASYFESFEVIKALGGDLAIVPIANNEAYNKWRALRGIWGRVQETHIYGMKASLNGWLAGMEFTGHAGVFAPIIMTEEEDGVLAISENPSGDELVIADLDLPLLEEAREKSPYFGDENPAFEREYLKKLYGKATPSKV